MLYKITNAIRDIEDAKEELKIILSMYNISFREYLMIKRGELDFPERLNLQQLEQINLWANSLKEAIDELNKIKREFLTW